MDSQRDVLAGRLAVVTGSTHGLGFAMARLLGRHGATVVLASRSDADVSAAVDWLREEGIAAAGVGLAGRVEVVLAAWCDS